MILVVSVGCLILFLLAFTGASALARKTGLVPAAGTHGIGSDAILGAALVVFASGLLMMAGLATAWVTGAMLTGLASVGAAKLLLAHRKRPAGRTAWPLGLVLAGAILAVALLVMLALPPSFNAVDDGFAYLALVRDVAVHGVGSPQPFSERRLFTYGGHWPMAGIADRMLGLEGLSLIDPALGLALLGLLIMERVRRGAMPTLAALATLAILAVVLMVASPIKNTIPIMLPLAFATLMLLRLLETWTQKTAALDGRIREAIEMGLLAGAATTFRATSLPFSLMLLGAWCLLAVFEAFRSPGSTGRGLIAACVAPMALVAVLAPFAIALQHSSGTALFPLLGPGVHVSRLDAEAFAAGSPVAKVLAAIPLMAVDPGLSLMTVAAVAGVAFGLIQHERGRAVRIALAWLALFIATSAVGYATEGIALYRYSFSFTFALPIALLATAREPAIAKHREWKAAVLPLWTLQLLLVVAVAAGVAGYLFAGSGLVASRIEARLTPRLIAVRATDGEMATASRIAALVPPEATILAFWPRAYLLSPDRNRVLLNDQPLRAGPDPFWPASGDPEAMREYLRGAGVDFVLSAAVLPLGDCSDLNEQYQWYRRMYEAECSFKRFVESPAMRDRVRLSNDNATLLDIR